MILSCDQASACAKAAAGSADAGKALGWTTQIVDGKGDPAAYNAALRNAAVSHFDAVINIAVPPGLIQDGLRVDQQNHVDVINASEHKSNDPKFAAETPINWPLKGRLAADWIIADSKGRGNVVLFRDDEFPGIKQQFDIAAGILAQCTGCTILAQTDLTIKDVTSPRMAQVTKAAIARFGKRLQYIVTPYDAADGFVIPVLQSSHRTDIKYFGFVGGPQQIAYCHQGLVSAAAADITGYIGWAAADSLDRVFAHQPQVNENPTIFLLTPKLCPASGNAEELVHFNYRSKFKALWTH
jgi:ribose transport system substrate-binding protein